MSAAHTKYERIIEKAYQAFFSPARYETKPAEHAVLERGASDTIPFDEGELAVSAWGDAGPAVLLMHGWGGSRAQMTALVDPLVSAGFRVVAYDQPAHGETPGVSTNLLKIAPTMALVEARKGPFDAIVAHSFGTLISSYALVNGMLRLPRRLVFFGAFNRLMDSLPRFQAQAGLPDQIAEGLREKMYAAFGQDVLDAISNDTMAPKLDIPALLFHDAADPVTPIEDSRAIARAWPRARLVETEGLGHRGALRSAEIQSAIVAFLLGG